MASIYRKPVLIRDPKTGRKVKEKSKKWWGRFVDANRERMDYPEYRRLGLPVSSAPVESTIKQINRRLKGSEKFWLTGGAEAMLQLRAAQLSDDGRWARNWLRSRPHRAAGAHRLAQAA